MIKNTNNMIKKDNHIIRQAFGNEVDELTSLAMKSKAYWGYDYSFLRSCVEELSVTKEHVNNHTVYVVEKRKELIGFYVLQEIDTKSIEMTFLFVDPKHIRSGIGKVMFNHAATHARELGYSHVIIQSDPFAAVFYEKMGCKKIGTKPSGSISDRDLPLFRYQLK
jgi:N-acetylglutamate synthase-like GNAT family acetyltransferase